MATEQAKAAPDTSTAAPATDAGNTPQIDAESVTMEQLDQLFETGSAELPVKSGGEEKKGQADTSKAKESEPPKAGDEPPKVVEAPKVDDPPKVDEVVESRSDEEVETAVSEAVEAVKADGGDQVAQDAAADEARKPVAKVEAPKVDEPIKPKVEPEDKSRRFRVKDPIAQAALEIYKTFENTDTPISLAEAEKRVRGDQAPPKKEEAGPDLKVVVGTLETEVADIEKKLEEAGVNEGLYNADIAKLNISHTKKVAELESAKRDLRDEAAATQLEAEDRAAAFKNTVATSRAKAIELYPDVADDSTPLGKAVSERIVAMRSPDHPDHNLLFTGSAPETITVLEAAKLGIQPAAKVAPKVEPPPVKKSEIPPKRKVEPVSGVKTAAGKGPTPEDAKNTVEYLKSDKASLEELDSAFGAKNPLMQLAV